MKNEMLKSEQEPEKVDRLQDQQDLMREDSPFKDVIDEEQEGLYPMDNYNGNFESAFNQNS